MSVIRLKRRLAGGASGAPASLATGELAWNQQDNIVYGGFGDNGSGVATSIVALAGLGLNLGQFAATTSTQLASVISDGTGSGAVVFGTAPTITGGLITALTSFGVRSTGAAFDLKIASSEVLTAARTLSVVLGDASRTLTFAGNATISGTNTGDQTITLTGDVTGSGTGSFVTTIGANKVADTMIRQSAGLSVIGRSANSTGNVTDITSTGSFDVMRRSGSAIGFGTLDHTYISDFDTQVRTSSLDQMTAPAANVSMNTHKITNLTDPTSAQDAATKSYVDSVASGLDPKSAVRLAATSALAANTYANGTSGVGATLTANANGALSVDGVTPSVNDRILVRLEATDSHNGIYVVTQVGSGAAPYILTRATDADTAAEVTDGMFCFVEQGTANAATGWILTTQGAITIGTTSQAFAQFSASASYSAGTGISVSGSVISIDTAWIGQTAITTLGTITTGTWHGSVVGSTYGGTGVNNGSATLTMGGSVTHAGAFTTTITVTANTSVTLPTSGTILSDGSTIDGGTF